MKTRGRIFKGNPYKILVSSGLYFVKDKLGFLYPKVKTGYKKSGKRNHSKKWRD